MKISIFLILIFFVFVSMAIDVLPLQQNYIIDCTSTVNLIDKSKYIVIVTGNHDKNHLEMNHNLLILNSSGDINTQYSLPSTEGCYGKIITADIDNDKQDEIMLTKIGFTDSLLIFKYQNGQLLQLQPLNSKGLSCRYENGFKISVKSNDSNLSSNINYNLSYNQLPSLIAAKFSNDGKSTDKNVPTAILYDYGIEKNTLTSFYRILSSNPSGTIAIAKVTWDFKNSMLIPEKVILSRYLPSDDFIKELKQIDTSNKTLAISQGINLFHYYYDDAPSDVKNRGIAYFNNYHYEMIKIERFNFNNNLDTYRKEINLKFKDSKARDDKISAYIKSYNESNQNISAGFEAFYTGEGEWNIQRRNNYFSTKFPSMTDDAREYFTITDKIISEPAIRDGGIVILVSEIYYRISAMENFLSKYPDSLFSKQINELLYQYLVLFVTGTDNTPIYEWNTKIIKPSVKNDVKRYIESSGDSIYKLNAKNIYQYWEKNNFKYSTLLLTSTLNYLKDIDATSASSYYPLNKDRENKYLICGEKPGKEIYRFTGKTQRVYSSLDNALKYDETMLTVSDSIYDEKLKKTLLKESLIPGTKWSSNGIDYKIEKTGISHQVFDKKYLNVIMVTGKDKKNIIEESYYALGIGLIEKIENTKSGEKQMLLLSSYPQFSDKQLSFQPDKLIVKPAIKVKSSDNLEIKNINDITQINIVTKTGIGSADITKEQEIKWPKHLHIIFNNNYMESFIIEVGETSYQISYTSTNQLLEDLVTIENGKRKNTTLTKNMPVWISVTPTSNKFLIIVPAEILKDSDNIIKISWIDQYR